MKEKILAKELSELSKAMKNVKLTSDALLSTSLVVVATLNIFYKESGKYYSISMEIWLLIFI